jgi:hypothetical protein
MQYKHQTIAIVCSERPEVPFTPPSVSGLLAWYDASDTATLTLSGSEVTQWDDKSGNDFHLTRGLGQTGPASGTRTKNGLNVVDFVNTAGGTGGKYVNDAGAMLPADGEYDIFAVWVHDNVGANFSAVAYFGTGTEHGMRMETTTESNIVCSVGGGAQALGATRTAGTWRQVTGELGSTGGQPIVIRQDGAADNSSTLTGAPNSGSTFCIGARVGGGRSLDGAVGEVLIYRPSLSDTDRDAVEDYLIDKWAIP